MDQRLLKRFIAAKNEFDAAEARVAVARDKRDKAEQALLAAFERDGLSNVKTTSGETVYLHRQLWARARSQDRAAVTKALHALGLDDLVSETFNTNQLSAYVREHDKAGTEVPAVLADVIEVSEVFALRVRRA